MDTSEHAQCLPHDFFREFLSSRLDRKGVRLSERFEDPRDLFDGWQYYGLKTKKKVRAQRAFCLRTKIFLSGYHAIR